eukprot:766560-Hanusia_phi.AAC.1
MGGSNAEKILSTRTLTLISIFSDPVKYFGVDSKGYTHERGYLGVVWFIQGKRVGRRGTVIELSPDEGHSIPALDTASAEEVKGRTNKANKHSTGKKQQGQVDRTLFKRWQAVLWRLDRNTVS